jgi:signal transduction histidine kinase
MSRMTATSEEIDARWLQSLNQLVERVSHELKGALNGVSVNQEVIRSRSQKASATAASLITFIDAAVSQLDVVMSLTDALLGLTRRAREPVDIGAEARRIAILLAAVARADSRQLSIDDGSALNALGVTSAAGSAVRLVICECMLAALEASTNVHCKAVADSETPVIRIESEDGSAMAVESGLVGAARDAGITVQADRSAVSISFPR